MRKDGPSLTHGDGGGAVERLPCGIVPHLRRAIHKSAMELSEYTIGLWASVNTPISLWAWNEHDPHFGGLIGANNILPHTHLLGGVQIMRRIYSVSIGWFILYMALLTVLCAAALTLALLRWPVATGVVMAAGVSVAMLVCIYQIVTSGSHQVEPQKPIGQSTAAPVDGAPVREVEVLR